MPGLPCTKCRHGHVIYAKSSDMQSMHGCIYSLSVSPFLSTADFGDFNRYDSQEFLQKFVLFPIVSASFFALCWFVFDTSMVSILRLSFQDWIQDERVLEEATQKVALLYQSFRWAVVYSISFPVVCVCGLEPDPFYPLFSKDSLQR